MFFKDFEHFIYVGPGEEVDSSPAAPVELGLEVELLVAVALQAELAPYQGLVQVKHNGFLNWNKLKEVYTWTGLADLDLNVTVLRDLEPRDLLQRCYT